MVTKCLIKVDEQRKGLSLLKVKEHITFSFKESKADGHIMSPVKRQREKNYGSQLALSFLFNLR